MQKTILSFIALVLVISMVRIGQRLTLASLSEDPWQFSLLLSAGGALGIVLRMLAG